MKRTAEETNVCTAWIAGTGHEIEAVFKGHPFSEFMMDLHNNSVGRNAGENISAIDQGQLWVLPSATVNINPYYTNGELWNIMVKSVLLF